MNGSRSPGSECFVIMPFGMKQFGTGGREIDFDLVYRDLIQRAVAMVPGLQCLRCDDLEQPGWIHERMLEHIFKARVAIVDLSALNANVFYELGVRHALCRGITVLLKETGTTAPFNLAGMDTIAYTATPAGISERVDVLARYLKNSLGDPSAMDSLVHKALPQLRIQRVQSPAARMEPLRWHLTIDSEALSHCPEIGFVTGDRRDLVELADTWVNSENTLMQMDSFYGKSTSATIRYLGARKNEAGIVEEDTIAEALRRRLKALRVTSVDPATVIETTAGALEDSHGVERLLHVAAVVGQPLQGWRPVQDLAQCVKAPLRKALNAGARAVLLPIFGTGPGGGDLEATMTLLIDTAVEFLRHEKTRAGRLRHVYFYVWGEDDLVQCKAIADRHPALRVAT
jgi:O-acetyl-ADP-ribose deacetylase (regulator of RNase III)